MKPGQRAINAFLRALLAIILLGLAALFAGVPSAGAQQGPCKKGDPNNPIVIGFQTVIHRCVCSPPLGLVEICTWQPIPGAVTPLPPTITPTASPTPTATTTPQPTATPAALRAPAQAATIADFEKAGSWKRGNEPYGTFTQSQEQRRSGAYAQKLAYDFPAGVANNYVVFRQPIPIPFVPDALRLQVFGDGSQHFLNAWLQDAQGQLWQFTFGRINHTGWQLMEAPLDPNADWPNGPIGSVTTPAPVAPLRFYAFVLDGYTSDRAFQGAIYLDDLQAVSFKAVAAPAATAQAGAPSQPAAQAAQTASSSPGLLTNFESWGTWKRGDEPWGTFSQSGEQHVSGKFAGKLAYDFPADPKNYVVFKRQLPIKGQATALRLQVFGDGSTHFLNAWVQDAQGQLWQFTFGRINHSGWQAMTAPFDLSLGWPNQAVGAAKTSAPVYPLRFYAFVLDGYASDQTFQGAIYLDDLEAVGP